MIDLDEIKLYLRITHEKDDAYLEDLIELAKTLIEAQTGVSYDADNEDKISCKDSNY